MSDEQEVLRLLPRVAAMARHFSRYGVSFDDLKQEGAVALLEAAQRYEKNDHCAFYSFAYHRVRGAMVDLLRANQRHSKRCVSMQDESCSAIEAMFADEAQPEFVEQVMQLRTGQVVRRKLATQPSYVKQMVERCDLALAPVSPERAARQIGITPQYGRRIRARFLAEVRRSLA